MKKVGFNTLILICSFICINVWADHYTPEQQKKIKQVQQSVRQDLMNGNIEHARNQLEETAGQFHSEEIELAMVQTLMQAGEYRHALSAAAHSQAEHKDFTDATLFYAWLLAIGGQELPAKNLLTTSREQYPHAALKEMLAQINNGQLNANAFNSLNMQLQPIINTNARLTGQLLSTGILVDDNHIVTSRSSLGKNTQFSVRNAMGHIFNAHLDETVSDAHIANIIIENPTPLPNTPKIIDKAPFPGAPMYCVGFKKNPQANWPQLLVDMLGKPIEGKNNLYSLNAQTMDEGTGLYNLSGLLIGIVINDGTATRKVKLLVSNATKNEPPTAVTPRISADQMYENAMRTSVQIFTKK